jgi:hypothetical protein
MTDMPRLQQKRRLLVKIIASQKIMQVFLMREAYPRDNPMGLTIQKFGIVLSANFWIDEYPATNELYSWGRA